MMLNDMQMKVVRRNDDAMKNKSWTHKKNKKAITINAMAFTK
jgi:hypothetical protein